MTMNNSAAAATNVLPPPASSLSWKSTEAGEQFFRLLDSAKVSIALSTWILSDNPFTAKMVACLRRKAKAGVKVFVVYFGGVVPKLTGWLSRFVHISEGAALRLRGIPGVEAHEHVNAIVFGTHEKLLVIDEQLALFSDRNLGEHYYGPEPMYTGLDVLVHDAALAQHVHRHIVSKLQDAHNFSGSPTSFRIKDPFARIDYVTQTYVRVIDAAEGEMTLVNCVFLPLPVVLRALRRAVRDRGVQLTVVVDNVDEITDDISVHASRDAALGHVLQIQAGCCGNSCCCLSRKKRTVAHRGGSGASVRLLGYNGKGSSLHSKYLITDKCVVLGSYNMDFYSQYQEVEYVIDSTESALIAQLRSYTNNVLLPLCVPVPSKSTSCRRTCDVAAWFLCSEICPCAF